MTPTKANVTREAVLRAIAECDALGGREAFRLKHGYGRSKRFVLVHEGREYDSKAILGVAFGYQYDCPPLKPSEHSGGAEHCGKLLQSLGFTVRDGGTLLSFVAPIVRRVIRAAMSVVRAASLLTVGLVSCTLDKRKEGPVEAQLLYDRSWVFRKAVAYLEPRCDAWHVLSAKHGVLDPTDVVEWYDETVSGAPKRVRDAWGAKVQEQIRARYEGRKVKFILMTGKAYAAPILDLEGQDWLSALVEWPVKGLGTGFLRQWLNANT